MTLDLAFVAIGLAMAGAAAYVQIRANPGRRVGRMTRPWQAAALYFTGLFFVLLGSEDLRRNYIGWWAPLLLVPFVAAYAVPVARHNRSSEA